MRGSGPGLRELSQRGQSARLVPLSGLSGLRSLCSAALLRTEWVVCERVKRDNSCHDQALSTMITSTIRRNFPFLVCQKF